jgi:hypothetical protein
MGLLLDAVDVTGPLRWRWLLSDEETGNPVADHGVDLNPSSDEVARFRDLGGYVRSYAAPDRLTEDGARFVREAGEWAGRELLGESVGEAIVAEAPVAVRVKVPAALDSVLLWPLELAHAGGKPLAAQGDVTLVYDIAPDAVPRRKNEIGAALRMLAVFSQPTKTSVLALRRERYALSQLIRKIGRERARVELQVVQYGVTRERLKRIADSQDGWDVLHVSGHGAGGVFALEKDDGSLDLVPVGDLVELLRPVRRRVKLAMVSACESAADTTAETLRLIGLTEQAEAVAAEAGEQAATQIPGLARALVRDLDCAVVAMRYPVTDEFAIAFGDVFYEHLFSRRQPVDVAAARALKEAAGPAASAAKPAVSLATPGVFGARAAGLRLDVPRGRPAMDPAEQRMAYFPAEPARFVGRAEAMARASAALAPGSGQTAVLLHGMAGAGKTACALELAYRHADVFAAAAFWQAPTRDEEWASALADFAKRLDIQLGDYGFRMANSIGTVAALQAFLPRLRAVMANSGVLLVLDNLETVLTPEGGWRDPRWELLITALTSHDGESRVILTSRVAPASVASGVETLRVHALSLGEAVALARELPNLRELLHADAGPVRAATAAEADRDRDRVLRVLRVVQGHPKLMELADAAAADRDRLDAQLAAAEEAAEERGGLEAFFRDGASTLEPGQFLDALAGWTESALGVLSAEARLMAEFVACLEDGDRVSYVIDANWADLWQRLARRGDPPESRPLLAMLAAAALLEPEVLSAQDMGDQAGSGNQAGAGSQPGPVAYRMHPGVAAAVIAVAGPEVREAADAELAAFWVTITDQARQRESGEDSGLMARAGLAAAPYLLRCGDWNTASSLLEDAVMRDGSPGTVQAVLPALRRIAAATGTPAATGVLARALSEVDPGEAERLLRAARDAAVDAGDYQGASAGAGDLTNLLLDAGRLAEALEAAGQAADYTRRAGLGPWTQLLDQARRLQVLGLMGKHARVLAEVDRLRMAMAELPARSDATEAVTPWNVRETILDTGITSALATRDWQRCLDLNAEVVASKRERGAGVLEVTRFRYNDAGPLIELGRLAEAGRLLADCQRVFEDHADTISLANVLSTRASLEAALGHWQAAADLEWAALRLSYARPVTRDIAICHHNLAIYLGRLGGDRAGQRAHRLAAALLFRLVGMAHDLDRTVRTLAAELGAADGAEALPSTVAEVAAVAGRTEGVRVGELLAALQPDPRVVEAALAEILATAAALPPESSEPDIARHLQNWGPVIADIIAACQPGHEASAELLQFLDEGAKTPDWSPLVAVLRRILDGERGDSLLDGLHPVHAAIARETLARLGQERSPGELNN